MPLVKQSSIQKHPIAWGLVWAASTFAVICLVDYALGKPLPRLWITIPLWVIAGLGWGYAMKWSIDRKAGRP